MKLSKLRLKNIKGIRQLTLTPDGGSLSVYGENGTGKTTIFDALCWLITDADSQGHATGYFSLKTKDGGEVIHDIDHEVEAHFDCFSLKKVYRENWVTHHGDAEASLEGHSTDYFVDEVPMNKGDYEQRVAGEIDPELFKILSDPTYLAETMHWKQRRKLLLDMAGDISVDDIIAGDDTLARYPEVLDGKSRPDREKILKATKKKLDKALGGIPARLDELNSGLYEVDGIEQARKDVSDLKGKKETVEAKRSKVKSGGAISELEVERESLRAKKQQARNAYQGECAGQLEDIRRKVADRQDKVDEMQAMFREAKREYESCEESLEEANQQIRKLEEQRTQLQGRKPKPESAFAPDVCPVCERPYEDEGHDYGQYTSEFNHQKAKDLKENNAALQEAEGRAKKIESKFVAIKGKAANRSGKLNQRRAALEKAEQQLAAAKYDQQPFGQTSTCKAIESEIKEVQQRLTDHRSEKQSQLQKLDKIIQDIESDIEAAAAVIHKVSENERTRQRTEALKAEQGGYREELEQVEADLYIIERFRQAESEVISERVNTRFEVVEWKLFNQQMNGGIKATCKAMVGGIPFESGLNNGGRIKAGLDIIGAVADHTGQQAPVVLDNFESITGCPPTAQQVIALIVSAADESLRVQQGLPQHESELAIA